jgi:hypothetical protein
MEGSHAKVRLYTTNLLAPHSIVFSSDKAKELFKKNDLKPSEFLRPFGDFSRGKGWHISTSEKSAPINLQNFKIKFYDSERLDGISTSEASEIFDNLI